jgi:tRNA pseudouridine32 synthase/23S rRNA pseudouridine746 synthase
MSDTGLDIVAATDAWAVVDKPPGLLSVPGIGPDKQDCVAARAALAFPDATGPLIVHRLDMETSGLMVLGLTPEAQRSLSKQFEARTVAKRYAAILDGWLAFDAGEIALPLRADLDRRPIQIVDHELGKPALTRYRVVERGVWHARECTRVELEPLTGRTHQLRVHAAHPDGLDAPILGDSLYGDPHAADRLLLHATRLAFDDPATGERIDLDRPAPF